MLQTMYSIKEAAQQLGVEAHALRFWEEELGLCIARNEQGRRMYSQENMQVFQKIMEWKKDGLQLKEIKRLLHKEEQEVPNEAERRIIMYRPKEYFAVSEQEQEEHVHVTQKGMWEREEKAKRLQELLKQWIVESVKESNTELLESLKEGLLKELDYQFRLQEEREEQREKARIEKEEAHFRQLDENLRSTAEKRGKKKKKWFF